MLPAKNARIFLSDGVLPPRYSIGDSAERIYVTGRAVSIPILKPCATFELQSALTLLLMCFFVSLLP